MAWNWKYWGFKLIFSKTDAPTPCSKKIWKCNKIVNFILFTTSYAPKWLAYLYLQFDCSLINFTLEIKHYLIFFLSSPHSHTSYTFDWSFTNERKFFFTSVERFCGENDSLSSLLQNANRFEFLKDVKHTKTFI